MPSRRSLLSSAAALLASGALAGCSADTDLLGTPTDTPTETPRPYPTLRREPLHLGPDLSLQFPEGVRLVETANEATLTVIDSETTVAPTRVVGWLEAGNPVAVLGVPAIETMARLLEEGEADPPGDASYLGTGGDDPAVVFGIVPSPDDWGTVAGFTGDPGPRDRHQRLRDVQYVLEAVVSREAG